MNPKSKFSPPSKESSTLRWLLSFGFFLVLFAVIALLISYGVISLNGTSNSAVAQPAHQPTPAVPGRESPVLPSGAAGHAAASPSPQR
jgi:hypothetical protein